ncbi:hypothetical protein [Bradyrhizobium sp. JYMT SZCCT0180]|uniref:hypothetical protein n=1 Tax=Bradyrhizobium sp. JYMT SZCCT0180 TaxID=2807666 RepID=UPI001BAB2442|nr:hypothetical protein [Bradyrhizobium sp. JYMT SZCCT0180]MBR1215231.1 hypothetical protein [Bradyrhizobium sp. JYMT SZCCT0180]
MAWTVTNLIVQIIAGLAGAHIAAAAAHEHRFGFWGHSLVGLMSGALGGSLLQVYAMTVVTGSGSLNVPTNAETIAIQSLTGATLGCLAMLAVGFFISEQSKEN